MDEELLELMEQLADRREKAILKADDDYWLGYARGMHVAWCLLNTLVSTEAHDHSGTG